MMKSQKGFIFLTAIIILGIIALIISGLTTFMMQDVHFSKRLKNSTSAYFLAEGGAELAIADLYTKGFNFNNFPKNNKPLGDGTYTVTLNTSKYASDKRVIINSTGEVQGVSRTIHVEVYDNRIPAFTYPALGGGKMRIGGGSVVTGNVHSNNASNSPVNPALKIGGLFAGAGTVNGTATAVGTAVTGSGGTVNPTPPGAQGGQDSVSLPPFDTNFWNYYYNLAQSGGTAYSGTQTFTSAQTPTTGVIWVNGNAILGGTWTLTGCLVATGRIVVNRLYNGTITHVKVGNLPALMSKNSRVEIWDPITVNGLIYSGGETQIYSLFGASGNVTINGAIIAKGGLYIYNQTTINYVTPNPPGLSGGGGEPLIVKSWSE